MRKAIAFFKSLFSNKEDAKLSSVGIFLVVVGVAGIAVTAVRLATGVAERDEPLRFFSAAGVIAIGVIAIAIVRICVTRGIGLPKPGDPVPKDSFLHPDNLPKGRYKPGSFD